MVEKGLRLLVKTNRTATAARLALGGAPVSVSFERDVTRNADPPASSGTSIGKRRGPVPLVTIGRSNTNAGGVAGCCADTVTAASAAASEAHRMARVVMCGPLNRATRIAAAPDRGAHRGAAFLSALLFSLFSPSLLIMPEMAKDAGGLWYSRRLQVMTVYDGQKNKPFEFVEQAAVRMQSRRRQLQGLERDARTLLEMRGQSVGAGFIALSCEQLPQQLNINVDVNYMATPADYICAMRQFAPLLANATRPAAPLR